MSVFRFKKFNVVNERSAMKVNTDGVLLGAVMTIRPSDRRLLDIGTGTGTIALMAAQRVMGIPDQVGDDGVKIEDDGVMVEDDRVMVGDDRVMVGDDGVMVEDDGVKVGDDGVMVEDSVPGGVVIDAIDIDEPSATEGIPDQVGDDGVKVEDDGMKIGDDGVMVEDDGVKVGDDGVKGIPDQVGDDRVKVGDDRVKVGDDRVKVEDDGVMVEDDVPGGVVIDAIDIDEPSAAEAAANFGNSPWAAALKAHLASLVDFAVGMHSQPGYDLIFSNPPYFDNALQAPEERRNAARHTSTGLSYREILDFASVHLTEQGRVALVLPADTERELTRHARMSGLHLYKITRIRTVPRKSPTRIIAEFSRQRTDSPEDIILTIQTEGQYTQEYLSLTKEFYLFA